MPTGRIEMLLNLLNAMSMSLPTKHTYQPVSTLLAQVWVTVLYDGFQVVFNLLYRFGVLFQCLTSNDLQAKRVGVVGMAFVAEGFHAVLREQLKDIIPLLIQVLLHTRYR